MTAPLFPEAPGRTFDCGGFFTQMRYLRGQSPDEVERRLGYRPGRLRLGYWLLYLLQLPKLEDFGLRGYSQLSGGVEQGHLPGNAGGPHAEERLRRDGFDVEKLKLRVLNEVFTLSGERRLAKILPLAPEGPVQADRRDAKEPEYPPGSGIPQWRLHRPLPWHAVAKLAPGGSYRGSYE